MKTGYLLFLALGFPAGFLAMWLAVSDRDLGPVVIRDAVTMPPGTDPAAMASDLAMIQELQLELQADPGNLVLLSDLGNLHIDIQDYSAAIDYFGRALDVDPLHPDSLFLMGVLLLEERGDVAGAMEVWERLLASSPDHPGAELVREELARLGSDL